MFFIFSSIEYFLFVSLISIFGLFVTFYFSDEIKKQILKDQIESLSEWEKTAVLSDTIYHVGGGASDAYTGYKQSLLNKYRFVQLGETTLTGAAQLALDAMA